MNNRKICFIMCANDEFLAKECLLYIDNLILPKGYELEKQVIYGASSMTSGYNQAMAGSDAKYKVYLHQDVLIINKNFINEVISLFAMYPKVGMLGVIGNKSIADDGCPWSDGMHRRIGEIYSDLIYSKTHCIFSKIAGDYQKAIVLDGLLMVTQYDIRWREDLFKGWDFYDCSQSLEFWKAGYQVAVPHMDKPWCLHDNDIVNFSAYEKWRKIFEKEYKRYYTNLNKETDKKVIYQIFSEGDSRLKFPYPPVYIEKDTDYICFTDRKDITSKYWNIRYIENISEKENKYAEINDILSIYSSRYELLNNQIQIGAVFEGDNQKYNPVVTIPSFDELPDIVFDKSKITSTCDENGKYVYRKNPVYTNGKYDGRPLLLTIGVPVSNQIDTIDRCLSHIKPVLDNLDAELLVIDTGSTDGTIDVCRKYGARIVKHKWCDNMSVVRNEGIYNARGEWYMSIDDDEWFESVDAIINFFISGAYKKFDTASYIQRNYTTFDSKTYYDNNAVRMAKITSELHFEGRIHDALIAENMSNNCQILCYAHHYGFLNDDKISMVNKYIRNASILLYDVYEYPYDLRYNFQLANEFKCMRYDEIAIAYFFRGICIEREINNEYYGRLHVTNLLHTYYNAGKKDLFNMTSFFENKFKLTFAERAFLNYNLAVLALGYNYGPKVILKYYNQYLNFKSKFDNNPYDSQQRAFVGLHVCTNEPYIVDGHVVAFCAYSRLGKEKEALLEVDNIKISSILDRKTIFCEEFIVASDNIYKYVINKFTSQEIELWMEKIVDEFMVSLQKDEICERQLKRFAELLVMYSIDSINRYLVSFYSQFTLKMKKVLSEYSSTLILNIENFSVQEIYFYSFVLKEEYLAVLKEREKSEKINESTIGNNRNLFKNYMLLTGYFVERFYNENILKDNTNYIISGEKRAAYHIKNALDSSDKSKEISELKLALEAFPGFHDEIQVLLNEIVNVNGNVSNSKAAVNPENELIMLAGQLKNQAKVLIYEGKVYEAKQLLEELARYVPQDEEVRVLLENC